jgi:two-component system phosphate regulon response regulator OmpR
MVAEDGKALNRLLLRDTVDLIVLDLMMPGEDGLSICRRLRAANDRTPIIMLTAKGEDVDRIVGLEVGADDYLGKPFNPRELLARMHAVLRRRPPHRRRPARRRARTRWSPSAPSPSTWARARCRSNGEELPLTTGEFAMLKALVRHPRQPLSREKLALLARGREFEPFDRSLDVQVSRLRKLIEVDAASPTLHPDRVGRGLRLRAGRHELTTHAPQILKAACGMPRRGTADCRFQQTASDVTSPSTAGKPPLPAARASCARGAEPVLAHLLPAGAAAGGQHSGLAANAARAGV